jgi:hypothetical protein
VRKKSKLDSEIIQNLLTDPSVPESLLSGQQDLRLSTGSSSVSEYAGTSASSITPFGVYRQKGNRVRRIPLEKLRKQPSFIVGDMIVLPSLDQIRWFSPSTQRESYEKLLRSLLRSKTSKKSAIFLIKDAVSLLSLAEKLQWASCDTGVTLPSGAGTFKNLQRTGQRRTKKRSSSQGKRSGRRSK